MGLSISVYSYNLIGNGGEYVFRNLFKGKKNSFEIIHPHILITNNMANNIAQLKENNIEYAEVASGYICFDAGVFSKESVLSVGLHYKLGCLSFIELFRTKEYFTADYNIDVSFSDFNKQLIARYGKPSYKFITPTTDKNAGSNAKWNKRDIKIDHWIMDRFGPEEHLIIYLKE